MAYRPYDRIWRAGDAASGLVSLDTLKAHLRVTSDDENEIITSYGDAAVLHVEAHTQRLISQRSCTLSLPNLPVGKRPVELPGGDIGSLTSVFADGVEITGGTVIGSSPALLIPSADWPAVTGDGYPVTITYIAGLAAVPAGLKQAVLFITEELYERSREDAKGAISRAMVNAEHLMAPHRIRPAS